MVRSIMLLGLGVLLAVPPAGAAEGPVGVVSHVKVLSDKIEDVSSMEAWKQSFIRDGMSDREKALAIWETVVKFRHQDAPPNEYLQSEENVHDAIKTFNVYGYGMCCCAASNIEALARYAGLETQGRILNAHSMAEVKLDGRWALLDASLVNYFPQADGSLAGVDDAIAGVKAWYAEHPEYRGNGGKLQQFMRGGGWKQGPAVLAGCPHFDENGWLPAATHGWYSTMQEYDGSADGLYEYGYSQGYQVNIELRPGERLVRNWSNQGLHVNMGRGDPGCLTGKVGEGDLRYAPQYGDLAPGRIGNGTREYRVPLGDPAFLASALAAENLVAAAGQGPALRVADGSKPAVLILRMPTSYVYLSGQADMDAVVPAGGRIAVALSENNGLDWQELAVISASGSLLLDLGPHVFRRYDYRLKFTLEGAGTGLDGLHIAHDVQHSQRALPALSKGENTITFSAGPPEGTITLEGSCNPENAEKQLVTSAFHPTLEGVKEHLLRLEGGQGSVTLPVATPGEMTRLRLGCHYRARDPRDGWDLQVSFDEGQTFQTVDRCAGPTPGSCQYVRFDRVPAGTRRALVRWSGTQRNTTCIFAWRIDADYRQPSGGFRPVRVAYTWLEEGRLRRDVHLAKTPQETWTITCAGPPVMKSIALELADSP